MLPISRSVSRRALPSIGYALPSSSVTIRPVTPVTATSTPPRRHKSKSKAQQPPPPGLKTYKAQPPIPTRKLQDPRETLIFTSADCPPPSFWGPQLASIGPPGLTAEHCIAATRLYCDGATSKRDLAWARSLVSSHPDIISPYILHYLGIILVYYNDPHAALSLSRLQDLGWNMLVTAHTLDYTPSTLQLILHLEQTHPLASRPKDFVVPPPVKSAMARHQALVREGKDPSALALQAGILLAGGTKGGYFKGADEMFAKACRLGSQLPKPATPPDMKGPRKPRWLREGSCLVFYGKLLLEQGRKEEAEAACRVAALELDQAQAYAALAKIADDPKERQEFSLKAAMAGIRSACGDMAKREAEVAVGDGLPEEERKMRVLMAKEWDFLAAT